jgi:L-lactate dehydrogenase complex protein LldG
MPSPSTIQMFAEQARAVSAEVHEAEGLTQALALAVETTKEQGGRALAAPGLPEEARQKLAELCAANGLELIEGDLRASADAVHTGLTLADWGVAETGTLIIDSRSEDVRLASMLPLTHVVLLSREKIVPSLNEIAGELAELMAAGPGYLAFITGPSRTADIERVLTIGVHGPAQLLVILLSEGAI